jgi:hypothetical protein
MGRIGVDGLRHVMDILSPHLKAATSMLASCFSSAEKEPEPEERLAEYLRWREWRRNMGYSDQAIEEEILEMMGDEYEGPVVGRDAYHVGSGFGGRGYCGNADHGFCKRNEPGDKESDGQDKFHSLRSDQIR